MKIFATEQEQAATWENKDSSHEDIALCMSYWPEERLTSYLSSLGTEGVLAEIMGAGSVNWANVARDVVLATRIRVARQLAEGRYENPSFE